MILGGALTQVLSWRWCLYVNLVIAVPTTIVALRLLVNHRARERDPIDIPGVLTSALGLFALVYGFSNAETHSWTARATIVALIASPVLLTAFVLIERRAKHPLLPLHIIWDRARGGAYTTLALAGAGIFAVFLFLTYFLQQQLGLSPLTSGLAFLPLTGVLVVTSTTVQTRVIQHTGVKPLVLAGMTLGAIAMFLFTRLTPGSSYASNVLPGLLVLGVGMGCIFAPAFSTATLGVEGSEAGVASAMVNTSQQVGGSVGTSLLSTIFASAVASYTVGHLHTPGLANAAAVHGYTTAFWWSVGIFALGFLLAMVILPGRATARVPPSGLRSPVTRSATATTSRLRMAPGLGLALRRALGGDEHRPLGVCRECVGDAAEESAADGAPAALAADNQSGVNLLGDLIDRLGHRFVGLRDSCGRVVAALAGTRSALFGDLSRGCRFLLVDLAFVRYGDYERAGSRQLHRCRHPHDQYHGIGGLDQVDRSSQRRP